MVTVLALVLVSSLLQCGGGTTTQHAPSDHHPHLDPDSNYLGIRNDHLGNDVSSERQETCNGPLCVQKCCPEGMHFSSEFECLPTDSSQWNTSKFLQEREVIDTSNLKVVIGFPSGCSVKNMIRTEGPRFHLLQDGKMLDQELDWSKPVSRYCLENLEDYEEVLGFYCADQLDQDYDINEDEDITFKNDSSFSSRTKRDTSEVLPVATPLQNEEESLLSPTETESSSVLSRAKRQWFWGSPSDDEDEAEGSADYGNGEEEEEGSTDYGSGEEEEEGSTDYGSGEEEEEGSGVGPVRNWYLRINLYVLRTYNSQLADRNSSAIQEFSSSFNQALTSILTPAVGIQSYRTLVIWRHTRLQQLEVDLDIKYSGSSNPRVEIENLLKRSLRSGTFGSYRVDTRSFRIDVEEFCMDDEISCEGSCATRCDGISECSDGHDESDCVTDSIPIQPVEADNNTNFEPRPGTGVETVPEPTVSEPLITVTVGQQATFRCRGQATGSQSQTSITWSREDNQVLPYGRTKEFLQDRDAILIISQTEVSDGGRYVCTVTDGFTFEQAVATLVIEERPNPFIAIPVQVATPTRPQWRTYEDLFHITFSRPPQIRLEPARQVVRPGDIVRFTCSATGDQPITINWSKEQGYMPSSVVINGGELTFRGIETTDAGCYNCEAINRAGTARAMAEVVVIVATPTRPQWRTYEGKYWDSGVCDPIEARHSGDPSLQGCKDACEGTAGCTAVVYIPAAGGCGLLNCTTAVSPPRYIDSRIHAYALDPPSPGGKAENEML